MSGTRVRCRLDEGWQFHRGELAMPPARGGNKGGDCGGPSDLTVEERGDPVSDRLTELEPYLGELPFGGPPAVLGDGWTDVRLPHDWRIETSPVPEGSAWHGFVPGDVAYYRLRFPAGAWDDHTRTVVEFDGVMRDSTVWCNGFFVGDHLSGYTGARYDLTELLRYGDEGDNVLLVRCDCTTPEGWWYEGGGIYRDAWLVSHPDVHVDDHGIRVTTPMVAVDKAVVRVETSVRNQDIIARTDTVITRLTDPDGQTVGVRSDQHEIAAGGTITTIAEFAVSQPRLWSVGDGQLYRVRTELADGDAVDTDVGIRTVELRRDGLHVNGEHVPLRGANLHQDFAGIGVAVPDRIIDRKLGLLQEFGCNAVRSAHHPSSTALLAAADRRGILVIAENRLLSSAPPYLSDLEYLIRRDRNHACVFVWSLENEEPLEGTPQGTRILRRLAATARRLDPTRATMVGGLTGFDTSYYDEVDVVGAHYTSLQQTIASVHQAQPGKPVIADEDGLFPTVRGQYGDDEARGWASSFGTSMGLYAGMAATAGTAENGAPIKLDIGATWQWFVDHPESGGGFVWSGFDYFGEPTPVRWPVIGSSYGIFDNCGFPKDYAWLLRSFFRPEPLVHVLPHWTWPGREGERMPLWAYSNCDEVELFVNQASIGARPVRDHIARWDDGVLYTPGTLTAVGRRGGEAVAEFNSVTAGVPDRLALSTVPDVVASAGHDVAMVGVEVHDAEGRLCPWADDEVVFEVSGPGEVIGVGNGDPSSLEPHRALRRRAFRGRCLAVVRVTGPGVVNVSGRAYPLRPGSISINSRGEA